MSLGIDPRVDFACKLMLGSPEHPAVTIQQPASLSGISLGEIVEMWKISFFI